MRQKHTHTSPLKIRISHKTTFNHWPEYPTQISDLICLDKTPQSTKRKAEQPT